RARCGKRRSACNGQAPCLTLNACVVHLCLMQRDVAQHLPLRPVEFHILLSLAAGERHGYGIILDIQERGDAPVPDVGTMYRALARMVEHELIEAAARRPAPDADDE